MSLDFSLERGNQEKKKKEKQELEDFAFSDWREKTSDDEVKRLVPLRSFENFGEIFHNARPKDYFVKKK